MRAVARLIFTSLLTSDWLSIVGATALLGLAIGALTILLSGSILAPSLLARTLEFSALGAVFMGSMYLPSTYSRLAHSHAIDLLPYGRLKLFATALATILIVAVPIPVAIIDVMKTAGAYGLKDIAYYGRAVTLLDYVQAPFFWYLLAIAVLGYTWVYVVIWSAARIRSDSTLDLLRTLFLMFVPLPFLHNYWSALSTASGAMLAMLIAVVWSLFAVGYLYLQRRRNVVVVPLFTAIAKFCRDRTSRRYTAGGELRAVLGLRSRWHHFVAIGMCVGLVLSGARSRGWLIYFVLLAMVVGGMPAYAAAKSRVLWLRRPMSRAQLFEQVEAFYWRYAWPSVTLMVFSFAAIGVYEGLSTSLIALGAMHGTVTAIASLYLGLMQTGERRWRDAIVAVFTFAIAATGAVASSGDLIGVPMVTAILATLTLAYRFMAKRRWTILDWIRCRPLRAA